MYKSQVILGNSAKELTEELNSFLADLKNVADLNFQFTTVVNPTAVLFSVLVTWRDCSYMCEFLIEGL